VTPEAVAEVTSGLVEMDEWVGGTIIEFGGTVWEVMAFDNPGPWGGGNNVENDMGH
jgi:3-hydroxybutyrate dehydrogenase